MTRTHVAIAAGRTARAVRSSLADDLRRLCEDAGVTQAALARVAGLSPATVSRILDGSVRPTLETYTRLTVALGADFHARLYANTGPAIRDRHQARIAEALLAMAHPRWRPFSEVAVRRPARGWIDVVLHEPRALVVVATEIQSDLRRMEQLVRWSAEKADALPSWDGWTELGAVPRIERLLIVRWTRATRQTAREFARQLRLAYPAHPDDALEALAGSAAWPGPACIWARTDGERVRFVSGR
jgi:transcriptional regulator with XRE-family HTH domain